jgi:hypothetical protein
MLDARSMNSQAGSPAMGRKSSDKIFQAAMNTSSGGTGSTSASRPAAISATPTIVISPFAVTTDSGMPTAAK